MKRRARQEARARRSFSLLVTPKEYRRNDDERRERLRASREQLEWRILEILAPGGSGYSVEIGAAVGLTSPQAAGVLRRLEESGVLASELRASPVSGLGRRYYWLTAEGLRLVRSRASGATKRPEEE